MTRRERRFGEVRGAKAIALDVEEWCGSSGGARRSGAQCGTDESGERETKTKCEKRQRRPAKPLPCDATSRHWDRPSDARSSVFREVAVLEPEVALLALAPRTLPVEVDVHALLVLLRDRLRLGMPLEPRQILHVEPPRLAFELLRREVPAERERVRGSVSGIGKWHEGHCRLTAGTCQGDSRTRKRASQHLAARKSPAY